MSTPAEHSPEPASNRTSDESGETLPTAIAAPRHSAWWIVPVIALIVAVWLGWSAWRQRGVDLEITFVEAHGLKTGDPVRYRGVDVGFVRAVEVGTEGGVHVRVSLQQAADLIARSGSRFWLVRPELGLDRVRGLETIVGARYVALIPGHGPAQHTFIGLEEQPVLQSVAPGDLEIIVEATTRGSLAAGSPVTYRGVPIGAVHAVSLAPDAVGVELRVVVREPYAALVRERTIFWDAGGILLEGGLVKGLRLELDSIASLLTGSLALAVPDLPGPPAAPGARYTLAAEPENWQTWSPRLAIGGLPLPPDWIPPQMERAALTWRDAGILASRESRTGWALPTESGLLMPASLARIPDDARRESTALVAGGRPVPLALVEFKGGIAVAPIESSGRAWPRSKMRGVLAPEDCVIVTDAAATPLVLPAARLEAIESAWRIDARVPINVSMHGAPVVAQRDGAIVGVVAADPGEPARVVLLAPVLAGAAER